VVVNAIRYNVGAAAFRARLSRGRLPERTQSGTTMSIQLPANRAA